MEKASKLLTLALINGHGKVNGRNKKQHILQLFRHNKMTTIKTTYLSCFAILFVFDKASIKASSFLN